MATTPELILDEPVGPVNRVRGMPVYRQVGAAIEELIARQAPVPGTRLPKESELAEAFAVNRLTVRQALAELVQRGLITTVHGRGSYVAQPPIRYDISGGREASLTRAMRAAGHDVSQRLLDMQRDDDPEIQRALGTRAGLQRYDLLRLVDELPWTLTRTWLPARRFAALEREWAGAGSLYDALETLYGIRMQRGARTIWAEAAGPDDARRLLVAVGSPVLVMRGHNVSQDAEPVAAVVHRGRADRVQFSLEYEP
jgi:GntR family transcriptional regulator